MLSQHCHTLRVYRWAGVPSMTDSAALSWICMLLTAASWRAMWIWSLHHAVRSARCSHCYFPSFLVGKLLHPVAICNEFPIVILTDVIAVRLRSSSSTWSLSSSLTGVIVIPDRGHRRPRPHELRGAHHLPVAELQ
jgi:hypothetical protein